MKKLILLISVLLLTVVAYSQPIVRVDTIVEVGGEPVIADVYQRGNRLLTVEDGYTFWITRKSIYVPTMTFFGREDIFKFVEPKDSNLARWQFFTNSQILDSINACVIDTVFSIPRR